MAHVQVNIAEFRQLFPAFNDTTKYPDNIVQIMLDTAQNYISANKNEYVKENVIKQMIYLMTAHLLIQNNNIASDNTDGGLVTSASVGGVSVSKAIPPNKTALSYWLSTTVYGLQLRALLRLQATVGIYKGGTKENVFR